MKYFKFLDTSIYKLIDKASDFIIWSCDKDFQIFGYMSKSVKKVLGYSQNNIIKKKCSKFIDENSYTFLKGKACNDFQKNNNETLITECVLIWKHNCGKNVLLNTSLYINNNKRSKQNTFYGFSKKILVNSEQKYALFSELLDKSDEVYLKMQYPTYSFDFISNSAEKLTGYTPEELKERGNTIKSILLPEWNKFYDDKIEEILSNNSGYFEYKIKTKNKDIKWIKQYNIVGANSGSSVKHIEAILTDITYEKTVESEYKESQRKLFTLLSNLPGMVYRCKNDRDWTMEFISHGVKELTGYFPEDFIEESKTTFGNIIYPTDRDYVWDEIQKALNAKKAYKLIYRIISKSGSIKWVWEQGRGIYSNDNQLIALEGFIGDFDQQKKADEENKKDEERLLLMLELSKKSHELSETKIAHFIIDLAIKLTESKNGYIHFIDEDQNTLQLYVMDRNTICCCPKAADKLENDCGEYQCNESIKTKQPFIQNEIKVTVKKNENNNKKNKVLRYMNIPLIVDNNVRMVIGVENKDYDYNERDVSQLNQIAAELWNILERKKDQQALYMEKERLSITLKSIQTGVLATNENGIIILFNQSVCKILGKNENEIKDKFINHVLEITDVKTFQKIDNIFSEIIRENNYLINSREYKISISNTIEKLISLSGIPVFDDINRFMGIVIVFTDITAQVKMEEELFKIRKLESIGNLAGGIAHDFNNLLNGIFGYIDLAYHYSETKTEQEEYLQNALAVMEKAKILTKQLLTFSKGESPFKETIHLGSLVKDTVAYGIRKTGIKSEFVIDKDLYMVEVDKAQIIQVIDCLTTNAVQAMTVGGLLSVKLYNADPRMIESYDLLNAPYIVIEITDTGIGIKPEHQDKIFDLFFTTKESKSGLGLAISYSIIKKHNGKIIVNSVENQGTTFFIVLPAIRGHDVYVDISLSNDMKIKKKLRILLLDDIEYNRTIIEKILVSNGYFVKCVSVGEEALEEIKKAYDYNIPYDCAILDLTVPGGMGGKEVALMLDKKKYSLKLIASSGYAGDPILAAPEKYGFHGKLEKPFLKENLLKTIYDIMSK